MIILVCFFPVFTQISNIDGESKYNFGWIYIAIIVIALLGNLAFMIYESFISIKKNFLYYKRLLIRRFCIESKDPNISKI